MAYRKVYFYQVDVFNIVNDKKEDYQLVKQIFNDVINNNAIIQSKYKTLDLTLDDDQMHVMMDIFRYTKDTLFCRLSKQKPNNSMIQRDYATYAHQDILPGIREDDQGIELYTYCSLNYDKGIFSIISAQGAPNEKAICNAILKYHNEYYITLIPIPNAEAISSIYLGEEAAITKVEIEVPVPPDDVMQQIFKWDREEIVGTVTENALSTVVVVKPPTRQSLTADTEETQSLIDCIKRALPTYTKARITGKAKNVKSQEYDLFAEYFSYLIDIPSYHIEDYERIWYTVEELLPKYDQSLKFAFNENRTILETITGRLD